MDKQKCFFLCVCIEYCVLESVWQYLFQFQDFLTYTLTGDTDCRNNFFILPALDGTNGIELRVQGDLTKTQGNFQVCWYNLSHVTRQPVSATRYVLKPPCSASKTSKSLGTFGKESINIILSREGTTKMLISLRIRFPTE